MMSRYVIEMSPADSAAWQTIAECLNGPTSEYESEEDAEQRRLELVERVDGYRYRVVEVRS